MEIDKSTSEWLFFKRHPAWLGNSFLRKIHHDFIIEENNAYPGFSEKLRLLAVGVLREKGNEDELQKALSILSVVGKVEDIPLIEDLFELENEELSKDVRTCVYEIKKNQSI